MVASHDTASLTLVEVVGQEVVASLAASTSVSSDPDDMRALVVSLEVLHQVYNAPFAGCPRCSGFLRVARLSIRVVVVACINLLSSFHQALRVPVNTGARLPLIAAEVAKLVLAAASMKQTGLNATPLGIEFG